MKYVRLLVQQKLVVYECDVGICKTCYWKIMDMQRELVMKYNNACQYCRKGYETSCQDCKEYCQNVVAWSKRAGCEKTLGEAAVEVSCDHQPECKCRENASRDTWAPYQYLTPIWSYYNPDTDYCELKCESCLTESDREHLQQQVQPRPL